MYTGITKILLPVIILMCLANTTLSALECQEGFSEVIIEIDPDDFNAETTWSLTDGEGNLILDGESNSDTICVDAGTCMVFTIYDEYGDGICCGYGQGSYTVYFEGDPVLTGGQFGYSESGSFNCPPGYSCNDAVVILEDTYTAPHNNYWYSFTPPLTGIYTMTTCSTNTCDTKIWIYDECVGINVSEDNTGTIYYDDNEGGCGEQAQVTSYFDSGTEYFIRIGSSAGYCTGPINWELSFGGEISGCMVDTACNFNPLATSDDGSCIYAGNPDCSGPDLWVLEDRLTNSLYADVINNNNDNCLISEGCVSGFGRREVVRFTTHIKNVGDMDYYIGRPSEQPTQFSYDNCHGHYHYEGYAEYRLANEAGELQPIGFKNGFCVLDLECNDGGNPKFGCSNMGISSDCGDYYSSGLQCQWIDVTGIPEGRYTLVVTVNWDRSPDALGNFELSYDNNWAQVCFDLTRGENSHTATVVQPCEAYTDCEGTPFGNASLDCLGNCGGTALFGDMNGDLVQDTEDAEDYIFDIINGGVEANPCIDLDQSGTITVYDAALINSCYLYGVEHQHLGGALHDHCNLPGGVDNPNHTVKLSIIDYDLANNTVDIGMSNPLDAVLGFEFDMAGMEITAVESLTDQARYPAVPQFFSGSNKIISLSLVDSLIPKSNNEFQPLVRITFNPIEGEEVCIDQIIDVVNGETHKVNAMIEDGCTGVIASVTDLSQYQKISVYPNPGNGEFRLGYNLLKATDVSIDVVNYLGQPVHQMELIQVVNGRETIDLTGQESGMYTIRFKTDKGVSSEKIVLVR